jgi:hypothetical protein
MAVPQEKRKRVNWMDFSENIAPAGAERKALIKRGEHKSSRLGEEAVGVKLLFNSRLTEAIRYNTILHGLVTFTMGQK